MLSQASFNKCFERYLQFSSICQPPNGLSHRGSDEENRYYAALCSWSPDLLKASIQRPSHTHTLYNGRHFSLILSPPRLFSVYTPLLSSELLSSLPLLLDFCRPHFFFFALRSIQSFRFRRNFNEIKFYDWWYLHCMCKFQNRQLYFCLLPILLSNHFSFISIRIFN